MATAAVPAIDSPSTLPQPSHVTLLLRHHKSTTLISVSPTQSLTTIKTLLLAALKSRNITALHNSTDPSSPIPLPTDPTSIELAVLTDKKDASKGWTLITPEYVAAARKKAGSAAGKAADADTPAGVGLGEGSWVAYRVKRQQGKGKDVNGVEVDEDGNVDVDVDVEMEEEQGWDVVIPNFEEDGEEVAEVGDAMEEGGS